MSFFDVAEFLSLLVIGKLSVSSRIFLRGFGNLIYGWYFVSRNFPQSIMKRERFRYIYRSNLFSRRTKSRYPIIQSVLLCNRE